MLCGSLEKKAASAKKLRALPEEHNETFDKHYFLSPSSSKAR
jgi:hypothetical protein